MNLLFYRVNPKYINGIIELGYIPSHNKLGCICLTRDINYLARSRPFVIAFDRQVLQNNNKITPFCLFGYYKNLGDTSRFILNGKIGQESEERIYTDSLSLKLSIFQGNFTGNMIEFKAINLQNRYMVKS